MRTQRDLALGGWVVELICFDSGKRKIPEGIYWILGTFPGHVVYFI